MTDNTQPEAPRLAQELDEVPETGGDPDSIQECAAELRRQHTRIAELEAQLESIGAGGVNGPLMGQPQAMPDLSQLTERGAKAWAGVDAQGLREGGADMSKERDDLTAFYAWLHTYESEVGALDDGSARVGFIAGRASLQPPGFTAADMATASAQGFRDGVASLAAAEAIPKALPTGWSLADHGDEISLEGPSGERWRYREASGTGTDSDFIYRFLHASLSANAGEPVAHLWQHCETGRTTTKTGASDHDKPHPTRASARCAARNPTL